MMNFEPPDYTKDVTMSNRTSMQHTKSNYSSKFQSPLLQTPSTKSAPSNVQSNKFNPVNHNNHNNHNSAVHSRLGPRNTFRPNNVPNNNPNAGQNDNQQGYTNFNRKRPGDFNNTGPLPPRRKWRPNKKPFYKNAQNTPLINVSSVQSRMNRIRSNSNLQAGEETIVVDNNNVEPEPDFNDSQEVDATDITVEVINHNVQPREDTNLVRFKMILDSKTQAAIKVIQQKRKDKQVIFPFPVTPNVTAISLHERFGML